MPTMSPDLQSCYGRFTGSELSQEPKNSLVTETLQACSGVCFSNLEKKKQIEKRNQYG